MSTISRTIRPQSPRRAGPPPWPLTLARVAGSAATIAALAGMVACATPAAAARPGRPWRPGPTQLARAGHAPGDYYGWSVAMAGNVAVAGAPYADGKRGAAYVFARSGGTWREQATLTDPGGASGDAFGFAVAVYGATVVVGAPFANSLAGAAYVYARSGTRWHRSATLTGHGLYFGYSVAVSGGTAIVGDPGAGNASGEVHVFGRNAAGGWHLRATFADPRNTSYDYFGDAVAISGRTFVAGAPPTYQNTAPGAAYVYTRPGLAWRLQATLRHSGGAQKDSFGFAVAIWSSRSGATVVVGAIGARSNAGAAYVFARTGNGWSERARLTGLHPAAGSYFGEAVAVSGGRVVVGAPNRGRTHCGTGFEFTRVGSAWRERAVLVNPGCVAKDYFGAAVAASGTTALVGAPNRHKATGAVYLLRLR